MITILRRNSKPHQIIKNLLLAGGVLIFASINPVYGTKLIENLIKAYFRRKRFEREKFLRDLKNLQVRKLIDYRELPNGDLKIVLTKAGRKIGERLELNCNLDNLKLNIEKKWDSRWRMIIFDIPDHQKTSRDALREKLRQLNFYPIQESVFITPYECEKEIEFICAVFDIRRYVLLFYISSFEGEEKLRHYFRIGIR